MFGFLAQSIAIGAHAVGLATHATPAMHNESLTEAYLTQPVIMADALWGAVQFTGMLNLEGLTLRRGELNAGVWGEGYSDRRHPHTYLHEAMLTVGRPFAGADFSLSLGRGFAPFGSDDPMVRPFVKYPANHHLAQILERLVVSGAVRVGPAILEGGLFAGAEPTDPEDLGDVGKIGDSWSARLTLMPRPWIEVQGSRAEVTSPENVFGGGLDHQQWHLSARAERNLAGHDVYGLVEVAKTTEGKGGNDFFFFHTFLMEGAVRRGDWQVAGRFEHSERPEEERQIDPFRTIRPATDNSIVGVTKWTTGSLQVAYFTGIGRARLQPFIEIARTHAEATEEFPVITPETLFGSSELWSFSIGIRSVVGKWHTRMGRYGAARVVGLEHDH